MLAGASGNPPLGTAPGPTCITHPKGRRDSGWVCPCYSHICFLKVNGGLTTWTRPWESIWVVVNAPLTPIGFWFKWRIQHLPCLLSTPLRPSVVSTDLGRMCRSVLALCKVDPGFILEPHQLWPQTPPEVSSEYYWVLSPLEKKNKTLNYCGID